MPVVLERSDEEIRDQNSRLDEFAALFDLYEGGNMRVYEISNRLNNPRNDSADVLIPAEGRCLHDRIDEQVDSIKRFEWKVAHSI